MDQQQARRLIYELKGLREINQQIDEIDLASCTDGEAVYLAGAFMDANMKVQQAALAVHEAPVAKSA